MRLYTIGTGHRPAYEFSRLLYKFGIQVLFDVRNRPTGTRQLPHFSRAELEQFCSANRINYVYLGNELGDPDRHSIADWLKSEPVQRGLKIIAGKIPTRVCCLLCSCYSPERCHRLPIANELLKQGVEVVHILEEDRFYHPLPQTKR